MEHTHIDVLRIVGGNPHLVGRSLLRSEGLTYGHGLELLGGLVLLSEDGRKLLGGHRTIVEHGVLHIREAGQEAEQLLRIGVAKLLGSHIVTAHIVRAINAIVVEVVEAGALVALSVFTLLENEVNKLLV